jgi:hypothetical protein
MAKLQVRSFADAKNKVVIGDSVYCLSVNKEPIKIFELSVNDTIPYKKKHKILPVKDHFCKGIE